MWYTVATVYAFTLEGVGAVGAIGVAAVLPAALLSPALGYIIDRYPRERVLAAMLALRFVALTVAIYLIGLSRKVSEHQLEIAVERQFPVSAVKFINEKNYSGPLYNHFNWGGYLIWALPRVPVSMDGRMNLHGDQRIERSFNTWSGLRGWESDPELMKARLVIGGVNDALTTLMRTDSRFKLVYEDAIAVVFVASTDGVLSN